MRHTTYKTGDVRRDVLNDYNTMFYKDNPDKEGYVPLMRSEAKVAISQTIIVALMTGRWIRGAYYEDIRCAILEQGWVDQ